MYFSNAFAPQPKFFDNSRTSLKDISSGKRHCPEISNQEFSLKLLFSGSLKTPSILLANVQSLRAKYDELLALGATLKPHVFALCESWLHEDISDDEIYIPEYTSFRCDRREEKKGGRVCVYVHETLYCEEVVIDPPPRPTCIECISLIIRDFNVLLIALYVPPNVSSLQCQNISDYLIEIFDKITTSLPDLMTIIAGDLNKFPTALIEDHLNLMQVVNSPTRGNAVLDKILLDRRLIPSQNVDRNHVSSSLVSVCPGIGNSDHQSVF